MPHSLACMMKPVRLKRLFLFISSRVGVNGLAPPPALPNPGTLVPCIQTPVLRGLHDNGHDAEASVSGKRACVQGFGGGALSLGGGLRAAATAELCSERRPAVQCAVASPNDRADEGPAAAPTHVVCADASAAPRRFACVGANLVRRESCENSPQQIRTVPASWHARRARPSRPSMMREMKAAMRARGELFSP